MIRLFAAMVGLLMLATQSCAQWYEGNELHRDCTKNNRPFIGGYITGVLDKLEEDRARVGEISSKSPQITLDDSWQLLTSISGGICLPHQATIGQLIDVACAYLRDNPTQRHLPATTLVTNSLAKGFQCQDKQKRR